MTADELPDMTGLLPTTSVWRNIKRPGSDMDIVATLTHLFMCKTQPHKCQIRNTSSIICRKIYKSRVVSALVRDIRMRLRTDHLFISQTHDTNLTTWIGENQKLVYCAMKEFYVHQLSHCHPLRDVLMEYTPHEQSEHERHSRSTMDAVRDVISRSPDASSALARIEAVCVNACKLAHTHITKLSKGTFEDVFSSTAASWVVKHDSVFVERAARKIGIVHAHSPDDAAHMEKAGLVVYDMMLQGRTKAYVRMGLFDVMGPFEGDDERARRNAGIARNLARFVTSKDPSDRGSFQLAIRMLGELGVMSREGSRELASLFESYELSSMPYNSIVDSIERMRGSCQRDLIISLVFTRTVYRKRGFGQVALTGDVALRQVEARRRLFRVMPWQETPDDVGVVRYCTCGAWAEHVTAYTKKKNDTPLMWMTNYKMDAITGRPQCALNKCQRPLRKMDMIGRCVRIANGKWHALCAKCGVLVELSYPRPGTAELIGQLTGIGPDCGYHYLADRQHGQQQQRHHGIIMPQDQIKEGRECFIHIVARLAGPHLTPAPKVAATMRRRVVRMNTERGALATNPSKRLAVVSEAASSCLHSVPP
ncbi:uncharacterized protein ACA1_121480 [Acanthamoeba castellanii str. Neff]|uniref:Uncharacterized protein n=1 Tax=Acanthamoeba castellanii (strain ATCC 30010 / Neff) TaxID=1257118 RepID=L8GEB4_ACACF|nr:uncharacterized protein ACA1_121480 [Acanthamoeba castellanii str. Neff]ELR11440.1 hypothetical protein ACA1_121480 [Acanthamoeba castellanii str. Neff]